jgi:hypothetical protein
MLLSRTRIGGVSLEQGPEEYILEEGGKGDIWEGKETQKGAPKSVHKPRSIHTCTHAKCQNTSTANQQ